MLNLHDPCPHIIDLSQLIPSDLVFVVVEELEVPVDVGDEPLWRRVLLDHPGEAFVQLLGRFVLVQLPGAAVLLLHVGIRQLHVGLHVLDRRAGEHLRRRHLLRCPVLCSPRRRRAATLPRRVPHLPTEMAARQQAPLAPLSLDRQPP